MNISGPSHEPWGIPPRGDIHSERMSEIFTRCCIYQLLIPTIAGKVNIKSHIRCQTAALTTAEHKYKHFSTQYTSSQTLLLCASYC